MTKSEVLNKLENDLMIRRYSLGTVHRYLYVVNRFLDYINNKEISSLDEYDVIDYLKFLTKERNYKSSSYNNINAILKFFLETTLEKNIGYRRLPNAKVEVRIKVTPEKETILNIIDHTGNLKYKCCFSFAYGSGLRAFEIAKLKLGDIDDKNMKVKVIGKGNKERLTLLSKPTLELLKKYCKMNNITDKDEYLFKGQGTEHLSQSSISRTFSSIVKKMKLDSRITLHSLRRSFATHLLRNEVPLEVVKELMGHNSLQATCAYILTVYAERKIKSPLD